MTETKRYFVILVLVSLAAGAGVWAILHYTAPRLRRLHQDYVSNRASSRSEDDLWIEGVEKVKGDRGEPVGGQAAVDVPTQLRHYSDTRWFLATQVAEVRKYNVDTAQDFIDLATMIDRREMVAVPAVTENYILLGVGANADDSVFSRFEDGHNIGLYSDSELRDEYARLDTTRTNIQNDIDGLKKQISALKKDRKKQADLQKQIASQQQELRAVQDDKALLDRWYGNTESRQKLLSDYQTVQALAQNFRGRSYDLGNASDRQALKVSMLRSLRPEALRILNEVAAAYHEKFDRPLLVSSLVRPEEYQHALHKVNRNAVLIDTPPHSTGLAFDIDYRYMTAAEQTLVMDELARLKDEGRIEVLRERNANYHVFAFINGARPSDELIAASVDQTKAPQPVEETHHAKRAAKSKKAGSKRQPAKSKVQRDKARNTKPRSKRRR